MMYAVLLFVHAFAAIVAFGPATYATSAFARDLDPGHLAEARGMHRVSRLYGFGTLVVALVGIALGWRGGWMGAGWFHWAIGLYVVEFLMLVLVLLPDQRRVLARMEQGEDASDRRTWIRATAGAWATLWAVMLWLMVAKPF